MTLSITINSVYTSGSTAHILWLKSGDMMIPIPCNSRASAERLAYNLELDISKESKVEVTHEADHQD